MKNSLFRYLCLAVALVSCNLAGAQQKANYQLAEKFRLLEQNPIDKYSTEVRFLLPVLFTIASPQFV